MRSQKRKGCVETESKTVVLSQERVSPKANLVEPDEDQLIKASQAGDQDAFAWLVQRYQRQIFHFSLRLVHDYEEASEVTQEAFVAAWQGLLTFRHEARFSTWLYQITYHCGLRQLKKNQRDMALQKAIFAERSSSMRSQERRLEDMVEQHEQQTLVRRSLGQLPAHYHLVLILRDFQQMTYQEMASKLALPMGTIKTHLFRARLLLKQRVLEDWGKEQGGARGVAQVLSS